MKRDTSGFIINTSRTSFSKKTAPYNLHHTIVSRISLRLSFVFFAFIKKWYYRLLMLKYYFFLKLKEKYVTQEEK